jgi:hypothetical protein
MGHSFHRYSNPETGLNELQRMQYLDVLGVDMFAPRWQLPGARESRQCLLPVATSPARNQNSPNSASGPGTASGAGHPEPPMGSLVGSLLESVKPQKAAQALDPVAGPILAEPLQQEAQAAFSLAFWRIHPQVMVVDSRQPKALPTEALLQALVAALGIGGQSLPRAELQNWPMAGGGDKSWGAAREMIHAFLESRLQDQPVRYLVLMGNAAVKAIAHEALEQAVDSLREPVKLEQFECELLLTPSLTQLLLAPREKAGLWPLLAPLRKLAATHTSR